MPIQSKQPPRMLLGLSTDARPGLTRDDAGTFLFLSDVNRVVMWDGDQWNYPNGQRRDLMLSPKLYNIETKRQAGSGVTPGNGVTTNDKNFRIAGVARDHWDGVQYGAINYETSNSVQGFKAGFAPSANRTGFPTPTGTFTPFTWSGAGSVNLPNAAAGATKPIPTITLSDWMTGANIQSVARDDGGKFPMWFVAQYNPVGGGAFTYSFESQSSTAFDTDALTYGQPFFKAFQAGTSLDTVGTPAGFTQTVESNNCNPFLLRFRSRGRVMNVMCSSDSIASGSGTTSNMLGPVFRACAAVSRAGLPVQYVGAGYAGRRTADTLAEAKVLIPALSPHVCLYAPYSPNDAALSTTVINTLMRQAMEFVALCRANDCIPILATPTPDNSDNLATSNLKISLTSTLLSMRSRGLLVADFWSAVAALPGGNVSTGYGWIAGYGAADGQHPSDTGADVMAQVLSNILRDIMDASI